MDNQNTELKTNLFEELSDEQLQTVVGGTVSVSQTAQGLVSGAGQTTGTGLAYVLAGLTAFNEAEKGFLGNTTASTTSQVPV